MSDCNTPILLGYTRIPLAVENRVPIDGPIFWVSKLYLFGVLISKYRSSIKEPLSPPIELMIFVVIPYDFSRLFRAWSKISLPSLQHFLNFPR